MKKILGFPRLWWPPLRDPKKQITVKNVMEVIYFAWVLLLVAIRMRGAKNSISQNSRPTVKLNRKSQLGNRNDEIFIEQDDVIYRSLILAGEWGVEESEFLASLCNQKTTLIDLGANVGLISRQLLNLTDQLSKIIVVEPRFATMQNLKSNLVDISQSKKVEVEFCEFALGKFDGQSTLYTETGNIGNSSLERGLTPNSFSEKINTLTSETFYNHYLKSEELYILKSDLQGLDATVLNQLPREFWKRLQGGVIEIWPSEFVDKVDILSLSRILTEKFKCSFDASFYTRLDCETLVEHWCNSNFKSQNLYLKV